MTTKGKTEVSLVGKWNIYHEQRLRGGAWVDVTLTPPYDMIVISADGKWEYWEYDGQEPEHSDEDNRVFGSNYYHVDGSGTWTKSGDKYVSTGGTIESLSFDGKDNLEIQVSFKSKSYRYSLKRAQ